MDMLELIPVALAAVVVAVRLVMFTPRGRGNAVKAEA
ncbi:MAG: hypothetical protein JWP59_3542 [Massilia sp.]|jgi:hypothetical protein|nr:hypothetical protein [Massilia sp.]